MRGVSYKHCLLTFFIFVCTDSTEIFFSKLRSAGLTCQVFSLTYCGGGGVSNKHCLLTFFIFDRFFYILAGNEDNHKISDGFKFRQIWTRDL